MTAEALVSSLLTRARFRHAFFTRRGGVSEGPFASLNFSWTTGDERERVLENLRRAELVLGVEPGRLLYLSQVHGVGCRVVTRDDAWEQMVLEEGDIVLSTDGAVACAVRVADCVPVLLADERSGAACAIHSGWVGTEKDVAGEAVRRLRALCGPDPRLIAAIGPHISAAAFEVGDDVAERLQKASPAPDVLLRQPGQKPRVDLRRIVEAQLLREGVAEIDHVPGCTVLEPERFYSFRRDGQRSGRHLAAIVPRPNAL